MDSEWAQIQLPNCAIIIFLKREICEVSDYVPKAVNGYCVTWLASIFSSFRT